MPAPSRPSARFVLLIGVMAALPAVTTDMYLPSLPEVVTDLDTTPTLVQATITGVLLGGAVSQLVVGPLTDRYGRRAPVLVGLAIHVLTSLLCMVAPGIWPLLVLRLLQGMGNAAAMTSALAVVRDRYTGAGASAILSRMMLVVGVAPLFAPSVGSLVAGVAGWRAVFAVLGLAGLAVMAAVWRFLPETLPPGRRLQEPMGAVFGGYGTLLRDRTFMALAVMPGLGLAVIMSYVAGSPFVLQEGYGLSENQFALVFAANGAGLVLSAQVNASLVRRFAPLAIIRLTVPLTLALGLGLLAVALTGAGGLLGLLVALWLVLAVGAFLMPNASALALSLHGERAGSAAALIGSMQAGIAGLVSPVVGMLGEDAAAMATVITAVLLVTFVILALATPAYRAGRAGSATDPTTQRPIA